MMEPSDAECNFFSMTFPEQELHREVPLFLRFFNIPFSSPHSLYRQLLPPPQSAPFFFLRLSGTQSGHFVCVLPFS